LVTEQGGIVMSVDGEQVRSEIVEELSEITGIEAASLTPDATLQDLDIDSLDLVEFKQVVEDRYEVLLERGDFAEVSTIGQALDVVERACTSRSRVSAEGMTSSTNPSPAAADASQLASA
jgi:acyl carrier protein